MTSSSRKLPLRNEEEELDVKIQSEFGASGATSRTAILPASGKDAAPSSDNGKDSEAIGSSSLLEHVASTDTGNVMPRPTRWHDWDKSQSLLVSAGGRTLQFIGTKFYS